MKKQCFAFILLFSVISALCFSAEAAPEDKNGEIAALRSALEKWVETKQMISQEKQKWQAQKEILIDRTRLLDNQVKNLNRKIDEAREATKKAGEKRDKLNAEYENLEMALSLLQERIAPLEQRVLKLLVQLPEPLREQIEPLSQEIPTAKERTELAISTRFQNLIGVLNFINKFNSTVTVTTEVRTLEKDQTVEVKVMYFGLAQAFFCNDTATVGGVGRPSTGGWKWQRRDKIAPAVASAMAMYHNEKPAEYIALPVEIVKLKEERE